MVSISKEMRILFLAFCLFVLAACGSTQTENIPIEEQDVATETLPSSQTQIKIDGESDDWINRPLLYEDTGGDAESGYLDFTRVFAFVNQDALYLLLEVVDPGGMFVQIDVELTADNERTNVNWRPNEEYWKQFPRSQFALGSVLEGRIDLRDIGSPEESVIITHIRAMVGDQPPHDDWWETDGVRPLLQPVPLVNEYDYGNTAANPDVTLDPTGRRVNYTTSGYIDEDEIWRDEIHITGDIEFVNGAVLTIEPGTIVYIASNSDDRQANDTGGCYSEYTCLHDDPTTRVGWGANTISIDTRSGIFNAEGTPDEPIQILPEGDDTNPSQFGTIMLHSGVLRHVKILYSNGVEILDSTSGFEVGYNEIRHCISSCLTVNTDHAWVHHNIIEGGGLAAISVGNHAVVEYNTILRSNLGIFVSEREDVILRNNLVIDCSTGIALNGRNIEVSHNTIAYVEGPPDGIYYQGEMVYPLFGSWINEFGIGADGNVSVVNNIIAASYPFGIFSAEYDPRVIVKYNLIWGADSWAGGPNEFQFASSNFEADPLFVGLENLDLHLLPGSPAIDAGFPGLLDVDGTPSDIGAYGGPYADGW